MSANIERDKWSESSKRSQAYHHGRTSYEDIPYVCRKCARQAVFTAEEQKEAYEVKKRYIWQRRTLCGPCNGELHKLRTTNLALQARWAKEQASLQREAAFMAEWLAVLQQFPGFGSRVGGSMRVRLQKLLSGLPDAPIERTQPGAHPSRTKRQAP